VSLLNNPGDSIERVAALSDGGYVVLGRRTANAAAKNITQLWVARLDSSFRELWRQQDYGLGTARGWALAVAGDAVFVAGTSSKGGEQDAPHLFLMRLNASDGRKVFVRIEQDVPNGSGRALALVGDHGKPRLYVAGTAGAPYAQARYMQLQDDGQPAWKLQAPMRKGAKAEGAVAMAFRSPGDGYAADFSFDGSSTRLLVSRLTP
jgi:hypothetical protein